MTQDDVLDVAQAIETWTVEALFIRRDDGPGKEGVRLRSVRVPLERFGQMRPASGAMDGGLEVEQFGHLHEVEGPIKLAHLLFVWIDQHLGQVDVTPREVEAEAVGELAGGTRLIKAAQVLRREQKHRTARAYNGQNRVLNFAVQRRNGDGAQIDMAAFCEKQKIVDGGVVGDTQCQRERGTNLFWVGGLTEDRVGGGRADGGGI